MVRVISILLAIEGEHHVIGVQVTGWFKVFIILPLHTLTEVESIGFAIRTDFPFLSKSGITSVVPVLNSTGRL